MHGPELDHSGSHDTAAAGAWRKHMTRYHWFVLVVAALGWAFDTMDQQLFNLARGPALADLLPHAEGAKPAKEVIAYYGGLSTSIFLLGWATGGLIFGALGDAIGRAKTMLITILMYSLCTGLSAISVGFWDFTIYRFITGLGVGGEFAVGVALVAESLPDRCRGPALGWVQSMSAVGNIGAGLIALTLGLMAEAGMVSSPWRWMFVVGAVPSLLCVWVRKGLREPEKWLESRKQDTTTGLTNLLRSFGELLSPGPWRGRAIIGLILASAGVIGVWGIGFFSPELIGGIVESKLKADGLTDKLLAAKKAQWTGLTFILQQAGGFLGMLCFARFALTLGRRPALAIAFIIAATSTIVTFWTLREFNQIFYMIPIMGFCQMSVFSLYAIYFPELFPTRLRATGVSFCYNVGRYVAAAGPFTLGYLTSVVYKGYDEPLRYAAVTMTSVFLIGLLALPFAPETKGKPLPE